MGSTRQWGNGTKQAETRVTDGGSRTFGEWGKEVLLLSNDCGAPPVVRQVRNASDAYRTFSRRRGSVVGGEDRSVVDRKMQRMSRVGAETSTGLAVKQSA